MPLAAGRVYATDDFGVGKFPGGAKRHVLQKVREPGLARHLVAGAHLVDHLDADDREVAVFEQDDRHAVVEDVPLGILQFQGSPGRAGKQCQR